MILKQFVLGFLENNNYLLIDDGLNGDKEAVLIDATQESADIENAINESGAKLKYILLTHGHFDHIMAVDSFRNKYGAKVLMHESDKPVIADTFRIAAEFNMGDKPVPKVDEYINENSVINFGQKEIKVIHTPGHTAGGVCFLVDNKLFTGDTIFFESVGRTDLLTGSFSQIKSSIEEKIFTLDDNIEIYPGHGRSSTVGWEKVHNQFL